MNANGEKEIFSGSHAEHGNEAFAFSHLRSFADLIFFYIEN